ncbi:MAG: N-acetyltransferase family protein [Candidatus Eremiobacteraeota bacterium]|nr:N-acetyltransferase family protein [Candidatus Eremiobacteraeota bacterium]
MIRRCTPDDAAALATIYDPVVANTIMSFELIPPGSDEMRRRITNAGDVLPWLVFERAGCVLGYVYASPHRGRAAYRWSVDVSAYVAPEARRLGIGRRLYAQLFSILTAQGYCAAFAGMTLPNEPSRRLHESVGFTPVGVYHAVGFKSGAWHDVMWFERRLRPPTEAPSEPLPLTSVGLGSTFFNARIGNEPDQRHQHD